MLSQIKSTRWKASWERLQDILCSVRVGFCATTPDPSPQPGYCRLLTTVSERQGDSHSGQASRPLDRDSCSVVILWLQAPHGATHWYYNWLHFWNYRILSTNTNFESSGNVVSFSLHFWFFLFNGWFGCQNFVGMTFFLRVVYGGCSVLPHLLEARVYMVDRIQVMRAIAKVE